MVWRFYNDTLKEGGTVNPTHNLFYVDSYKGLDSNVGSNVAPFQTIQEALDNTAAGGSDIVVAGRFKEGDLVTGGAKMSLIAEGNVYIEPAALTTTFKIETGNPQRTNFNIDAHNGNLVRDYGTLHFKDFNDVVFGQQYSVATDLGEKYGAHRTHFKDVEEAGYTNLAFKGISYIKYCVFDNTHFAHRGMPTGNNILFRPFVENNNVINGGKYECFYNTLTGGVFRDNYFDTSSFYVYSLALGPVAKQWVVSNNHFEGVLAGKFTIGSTYTNVEDVRVAFVGFDDNGKGSADNPQFKGLNSEDYTYAAGSPNAVGGWNNGPIGAFGVGYSANNFDGNWDTTNNITITGVGVNSVATITTPGSIGVIEETVGNELSAIKNVYVGATYLPGLVQDFSAGQVADKTKSADAGTPSIPTLEIQTSVDTTNGIDGTWTAWIEVPIGVTPLVDGAGKGNGDDTFNPVTGSNIATKWVRRRITLRDDEVPQP
jgi:hypothetical protein